MVGLGALSGQQVTGGLGVEVMGKMAGTLQVQSQ